MYSHNIDGMVEEIGKVLYKGGPDRPEEVLELERVKKAIEGYWSDKIAIVWTIEDIKDRAKDIGKEITEEDAREVLYEIHHHHDAGIGINWDVIDVTLEFLKSEKKI